MRLVKSVSLLILILLIGALFFFGAIDYQSVVNTFTQNTGSFIQMGIIYFVCLAAAPFLGVIFCFRGKVWKGFLRLLAALAAAGAAMLAVFPLKLAVGEGIAVTVTVCISAIILSAIFLTDKTLQHKETVERLSERGVKAAIIRRGTAIKTAYALFFENTGRIMTVITALYLTGDIMVSGGGVGTFCLQSENVMPVLVLMLLFIAVLALAGNLIGEWIEH